MNISNGVFDVCSGECKTSVRDYLNKDKEYKKRTALLIFFSSIGFIISMIFMPNNKYKLIPMYIGMIAMGVSLFFYPYIFSSFAVFVKHPIKKMNKGLKIVSVCLVILSIVLIVLTLTK